MFDITVLNVLWTVLTNEKIPKDDTKLHDIMSLLDETKQVFISSFEK